MKKRFFSYLVAVFLIIILIIPNITFAELQDKNECDLSVLNESISVVNIFLKYNDSIYKNMSTINVKSGDIITLAATPHTKVEYVYYAWDDDEDITIINNPSFNMQIPLEFEIGSTHWLRIRALFINGEFCETIFFKFIIEENSNIPTEEELNRKALYLDYSDNVPINATLPINAHLFIGPKYENTYVYPFYYWDNNEVIKLKQTKIRLPIEIPDVFEVDSEHTLTLFSVGIDGTISPKKTYTIKFTEPVDEFSVPISE